MDVQWLLKLCVTCFLVEFSTSITDFGGAKSSVLGTMEAITDDGSKTCKTKLNVCTIKLNKGQIINTPAVNGLRGTKGEKGSKGDIGYPGSFGIPGERGLSGEQGLKGERGDPGIKGEQGIKGNVGTEGYPGIPGMQGQKGDLGNPGERGLQGDKGNMGSPGYDGMQGAPGLKGDRGDQGVKGEQGIKGDVGIPGIPGTPGLQGSKGDHGNLGVTGAMGPIGPPGVPGLPGVCSCSSTDIEDDTSEGGEEGVGTVLGSYEKPAVNCKEIKKGGMVYIRHGSPFKVDCSRITNRTCILKSNLTTAGSYGNRTKGFWLSEMGINLLDIYGISTDKIQFLQEYSSSVTQTLRYNCKNSYAYRNSDDSFEDSLRILLWNDVHIGPYPTENTPIFYSAINDNCKSAATNEWSKTDIVVTSHLPNRLPIIDLYVNDVGRHPDQSFKIESVELCFG